jgi:hypothetical protein
MARGGYLPHRHERQVPRISRESHRDHESQNPHLHRGSRSHPGRSPFQPESFREACWRPSPTLVAKLRRRGEQGGHLGIDAIRSHRNPIPPAGVHRGDISARTPSRLRAPRVDGAAEGFLKVSPADVTPHMTDPGSTRSHMDGLRRSCRAPIGGPPGILSPRAS